MDSPISLALGVTGTTGSVIALIWWVIARGLHSRCLLAGSSITIDIHKETPAEKTARTQSLAEVVVIPTEPATVVEVPAQPKIEIPKHPKKHVRGSIETPRAV